MCRLWDNAEKYGGARGTTNDKIRRMHFEERISKATRAHPYAQAQAPEHPHTQSRTHTPTHPPAPKPTHPYTHTHTHTQICDTYCLKSKATRAQSTCPFSIATTLTHAWAHTQKYVILIAFPRQQWFANALHCYVIRRLPVLLMPNLGTTRRRPLSKTCIIVSCLYYLACS